MNNTDSQADQWLNRNLVKAKTGIKPASNFTPDNFGSVKGMKGAEIAEMGTAEAGAAEVAGGPAGIAVMMGEEAIKQQKSVGRGLGSIGGAFI